MYALLKKGAPPLSARTQPAYHSTAALHSAVEPQHGHGRAQHGGVPGEEPASEPPGATRQSRRRREARRGQCQSDGFRRHAALRRRVRTLPEAAVSDDDTLRVLRVVRLLRADLHHSGAREPLLSRPRTEQSALRRTVSYSYIIAFLTK